MDETPEKAQSFWKRHQTVLSIIGTVLSFVILTIPQWVNAYTGTPFRDWLTEHGINMPLPKVICWVVGLGLFVFLFILERKKAADRKLLFSVVPWIYVSGFIVMMVVSSLFHTGIADTLPLEIKVLRATTFARDANQTNMNVFVWAKVNNLGTHKIIDWSITFWFPDGTHRNGVFDGNVPDTFSLIVPGSKSTMYSYNDALSWITTGKVPLKPEGYLIFNTDLPKIGPSAASFALTTAVITGRDESGQIHPTESFKLSIF